jgi:tetratricopeptide (TPR) repeat protein/predicted transcriptional regulator
MPVYRFSPNQATAEERLRTFVARHDTLENLLTRVKEFDSGARHCILIGPRGIGKTHLLLLLADTIEADENLGPEWIVVRFAEEEYSISTLAELFQRVIELMPDGNTDNIKRNADLALAYISDYCKDHNKHVLLLMDNIQLYLQQFTDVEIGRMRDILMSKSLFLVIGAAPSYFRQVQGYDEAFYNFFELIHLNELSHKEAEEMLKCRADIDGTREFIENFEECQHKIIATSQLAGGNPRLILVLYQVICESGVTEAANAFRYLLDELTPYFQERMNNLPPQMRKVLDTLAIMGSPSTPTEIAETAGMTVQKVSSQLKRLENDGFVKKIKLKKGKETRYEVTERLYRMWREMRTETGKARLKFLIQFLNLWYSPTQLLDETGKILTNLSSAPELERQRLLTHLDYLKEASPKLMKMEMERLYSYAETKEFELATERIEPMKMLADIEERIQTKPDDVSAWTEQIKTLLTQEKIEDALESCIESLKHNPDDIDIWLFRAMSLAMLKRERESIDSLNKVREIKPKDAEEWVFYGSILLMLGKHEEAILAYDKAVQIKPDYAEAWSNRGVALSNLGRYDPALESYNKAVQIKPDLAEVWFNRGMALGNLRRHQEALESFNKAIQIRPSYAEAWFNHGLALIELDRHEEALASYDKAIQIQPDFERAWCNRSMVLSNLERLDEALKSYNRAAQIQPNCAILWDNRGVILGKMGSYDEALESFNKAIQIDPDDANAWLGRGMALIELDRHEEAFESYDKAVQTKPDYAEAWAGRGMALGQLDKYDEALESYDKAIQIEPDDAMAWSNRGAVLGRLGRYNEALESYDKAIQIEPDDAMAWSNRGAVLGRLGRYNEALESYDKAVQIKPDYAMAWSNRSSELCKLNRYDEALENCNKAIQFQSDNAMAWLNRSIALNNLGRHEEAMENIKKAEKLATDQGLEIASQFSATSSTEVSLIDSLKNLGENNLGLANESLMKSLKTGKDMSEDDLQLLIFGYIRRAIKIGKLDFVKEAIDKIVSELGGDYDKLLRLFGKAIDYMQTKDVGILERLQVEEREIVQEIAEER